MTLKQLEILLAIAKTGSFHGAAEMVHLTQPAISHQIKNLEEELGEALVIRSRPNIILLPKAHILLAAAERILAEIDDIRNVFLPQQPEDVSGTLRVAASTLGITYLYSDLFLDFIKKYPKISLIVTATESGIDGAYQVDSGIVDVAFTPKPHSLPRLRFARLGKTRHVAIVSDQHELSKHKGITTAALRQYPFIRYRADAGSRRLTDHLFLRDGEYPHILMETNDTELIKRVVATGNATAIVPEITVDADHLSNHESLVRLDLTEVTPAEDYGIAYRADILIRARELFLEFCRTQKTVLDKLRRY